MKKVFLIGDSIMLGYKPFVAEKLQGTADVSFPGVNGRTSENVLANLEEWIPAEIPDIVHINCGLHDILRRTGEAGEALSFAGTQVSIEKYEENLRYIFKRLGDKKVPLVIWATSTPVIDELQKNEKVLLAMHDVFEYNRISVRIALEAGLPINDLFNYVLLSGREKMISRDGKHFTPEGYDMLAVKVAGAIREAGCF
jgi:isoamyl acetate esterase